MGTQVMSRGPGTRSVVGLGQRTGQEERVRLGPGAGSEPGKGSVHMVQAPETKMLQARERDRVLLAVTGGCRSASRDSFLASI